MLTAAAVVVCALDLLGRSAHTTVPIRFLDAPPDAGSRYTEAFVTYQPDTIWLITSSAVFREAQRGRFEPGFLNACRKIASIIVHEEWHLKHGDDEKGAYQAQLTTLLQLHADPVLVATVRRSMMTVLAVRRRATPEFVFNRGASPLPR